MTAILPIPPEVLASHIAVLGKTGAGKSYLSRVIIEWLRDQGRRACIIDPVGVHWGIRLAPDGKTPSRFNDIVIFGGRHADLPLGSTHGDALAEIIGTSITPAIVDTSLMTVGERTRFFADFGEALLRKNKGPITVVIDEAHLFAPQGRVADPQSGKMLHAANNLVSLGRGRGFAFIMLSQRPAKLHKDSLTQAETLIAMRLIAPQDRGAVEAWIGEWADEKQGEEILKSLPSLPRGNGWFWAPELGRLEGIHVGAISTFDSFRQQEDEPALSPIDISAVARRLEAAAADAFDNDPGRLRKRIAELEKEVAERKSTAIGDQFLSEEAQIAAAERAREEGRTEGYREGLAEGFESGLLFAKEKALEAVEHGSGEIRSAVMAITAPPEAHSAPPAPAPPARARPSAPLSAPTPRPARALPQPKKGEDKLGKAERKILAAIVQFPDSAREKIGIIAGYSSSSGHFDNVLGSLRSSGYVERTLPLRATPDGIRALGHFERLPTGRSLVDYWMGKLGKAERAMLAALVGAYPRALTREQLGEDSGYSPESGHFDNVLGRLRTLELASRGREIRASEHLFARAGR